MITSTEPSRRTLFFLLLVTFTEPFFSDGSLILNKISPKRGNAFQQQWHDRIFLPLRETRSSNSGDATTSTSTITQRREEIKQHLLQLIASTPSNAPTTQALTNQIISVIQQLERVCPTPDSQVLQRLGGNWELVWTAQVSVENMMICCKRNILTTLA